MYINADLMAAITSHHAGKKVLIVTNAAFGQISLDELMNLEKSEATMFLVEVSEETKEEKQLITVESIEDVPKSSGGGKTFEGRLREAYGT